MTSIQLLRTLNDEELIAFVLMMSDEYMLSQWVLNVYRAKKFIREGKTKDYIACKREDYERWRKNLMNEASEGEIEIYKGKYKL